MADPGDVSLDAPHEDMGLKPPDALDKADISQEDPGSERGDADADTVFSSQEWVTDENGRVLILRGINVDCGAKEAKPPAIGPEDARRIAREWGFNFVRLLIVWEAVEPRPGEIDHAFLDEVSRRVDWLWAEGIRVMIDMHQDVYARKFCCDGAPEWAIRDDGLPFKLNPVWYLNYFEPAVQRAFDNFWDHDGPHADLQQHFAAAWAAVAKRFKDHPGVIAYDLFNEPHPGTDEDLLELLGVPNSQGSHVAFDREKLFPMYSRVIAAIRAVDKDRWIFVEPRYGAPANGMPSYHPLIEDPRPGPARIGYAPHLYSIAFEGFQGWSPEVADCVQRWERERGVEIARQPMPLVVGEWGFDWTFPGAQRYGRDVMAMVDRLRAGFAYWSYTTGTWGLFDDSGAPRPAADIVVRPYPRAVAGVPLSFGFDPDTRIFRLEFEDREGVTGPTEIYLAARRHYPDGWTLVVSDSEGTWSYSYDVDREILSVITPRTGGRHVLEIRPTG